MSCQICKRSACTESFHSLEEQELFAQRESMPDDTDLLRRMVQEGAAEILVLKAEMESAATRLDEYADAMAFLDRKISEKEARRIFGENFPKTGELLAACLRIINS